MNDNKQKNSKIRLGAMYIRESTKEQDKGFSPQNQLRMISNFADKNKIKLKEEFQYKDLVTGRSAEIRPDFLRMVADAKDGKFDVILVYCFSRFARSVRDSRIYKTLLRKKFGVDVISVTEPFANGDPDDPLTFLMEAIIEVIDEFTSRNVGFWVKNNLEQKKLQGFQCGSVPLGYIKKISGYDKIRKKNIYEQRWSVEEAEAKWVEFIHKQYATGRYSMADIAKILNDKGVRTKKRGLFGYSSLKGIITNKVYLGYVGSARKDYLDEKGLHTPIIKQELYDKCTQVLKDRRGSCGRPPAQHRFYLLQGLVYCNNCLKYMKEYKNQEKKFNPKMYCETRLWSKSEQYYYSCKYRRENKGCVQSRVACDAIDKQVISLLTALKLPADVVGMVLEALARLFGENKKSSPMQPVKKLKNLKYRKKKLNDMYLEDEAMSKEEYTKRLQVIKSEISKLDQAIAPTCGAVRQVGHYLKITKRFLKNFQRLWNAELSNGKRQEWTQLVFNKIWVKGKRVVAVEPTEDYAPLLVSLKKVIGRAPSTTPSR